MMIKIRQYLALFWLCCLSLTSFASDSLFGVEEEEFLTVEQVYSVVVSQENNQLIFDWQVLPKHYLYQHRFKVQAKNAEGETKLDLTFEPGKSKFDEYMGRDVTVYYESTQVTGPTPEMSRPLELTVHSQACADAGICYPPRKQYFAMDGEGNITELAASAYVNTGATSSGGANQASSGSTNTVTDFSSTSLITMILGAMLGGLILNLMPCVFPVLSLKALSLASSKESNHRQHVHGWVYTAGVVVSFLTFALVIILGRGAGESLGWGFQLQHPVFVAFMIYLFYIMGLSLAGFIEIGTSWMGAGQKLTQNSGLNGSFFTGVLAAVVASPCTAPFMATALGFALTQPLPAAMLVFCALGFGMAFPFLLLSYWPGLAHRLPAPGPWMDNLKQFFAFPLFATAVWLLWVLGHQASSDAAALVTLGCVLIAFAIWLSKRLPAKGNTKVFAQILLIVSFASAISFALEVKTLKSGAHDQWQPYSAKSLSDLRAEGKPVFVDLTADWCITCKINERTALNTELVTQKAADMGIVMMQGDWTNTNPEISTLLAEFGRSGVPLYLMYPASPSSPPEVLPQLLTQNIVIEAFERAQ